MTVTGTRNQAKMPEGEYVSIGVDITFSLWWDGKPQTREQWLDNISNVMQAMSQEEIKNVITDYEVE